MGGPLNILVGLLFFMFGIWLLDVQHGILRYFPELRSIINMFVQYLLPGGKERYPTRKWA